MKHKKLIYPITIILIIIVIVVILYLIGYKKAKKEEPIKIKEVPSSQYSQFDFNNKDNVEIKNNEKINISSKIREIHTFEHYEISNMEIYTNNGKSYFNFDIKNLNNKVGKYQAIEIMFLDNDRNIIESVHVYFEQKIKIGKTKHIEKTFVYDISNAYDYNIIEI